MGEVKIEKNIKPNILLLQKQFLVYISKREDFLATLPETINMQSTPFLTGYQNPNKTY